MHRARIWTASEKEPAFSDRIFWRSNRRELDHRQTSGYRLPREKSITRLVQSIGASKRRPGWVTVWDFSLAPRFQCFTEIRVKSHAPIANLCRQAPGSSPFKPA